MYEQLDSDVAVDGQTTLSSPIAIVFEETVKKDPPPVKPNMLQSPAAVVVVNRSSHTLFQLDDSDGLRNGFRISRRRIEDTNRM